MLKLFRNIILFFSPLLVLLIILISHSPGRKYFYEYLKDDCFHHGIWIHDRIFENNLPVDVVFTGSSHTINAVDDRKVELRLNKITNNTRHVVNIGYCRYGRNLVYTLLKDLLKTKKPELIIIEVNYSENKYSHPVFPYLAENEDVYLPYVPYNTDLISDLYTASISRVDILKNIIYDDFHFLKTNLHPYGFAGNNGTIDTLKLDSIDKISKKNIEIVNRYETRFPLHYLSKVIELCKKNNIKVAFLYLPSYKNRNKTPECIDFYRKNGDVLFIPEKILNNKSNWFDFDHLNANGSAKLSDWLGEELSKKVS